MEFRLDREFRSIREMEFPDIVGGLDESFDRLAFEVLLLRVTMLVNWFHQKDVLISAILYFIGTSISLSEKIAGEQSPGLRRENE